MRRKIDKAFVKDYVCSRYPFVKDNFIRYFGFDEKYARRHRYISLVVDSDLEGFADIWMTDEYPYFEDNPYIRHYFTDRIY